MWESRSGEPRTHLILTGGLLNVPQNELDDFYKWYLSTRERLHIIEQRTGIFKFFIDFDCDRYMNPEKLAIEFTRLVPGTCYVATSSPKFSLHFVWEDVLVDSNQAKGIRNRIVHEFGEADWAPLIDPAVYTGPGLRMLWSFKADPESTCYVPYGVCERGVFRFLDPEKSLEHLLNFSIRVEGSPDTFEFGEPSIKSESLEMFLRLNVPGQHNLKVSGIQKGRVVSTTSRYCENIKREHKSNHVWFSIYKGRIRQKCHDTECQDFSGRWYVIPPSVSKSFQKMEPNTKNVLLGRDPGPCSIDDSEYKRFREGFVGACKVFRNQPEGLEPL